jgi:hypothetical protein
MKPFTLFVFLLFSMSTAIGAQVKTGDYSVTMPDFRHDTLLRDADVPASFPAGSSAWDYLLLRHVTYPADAMKFNVQGKMIVGFVVEPDGRLKKIHAVSGPRDLHGASDELLKESPRWIAGTRNGVAIRTYRTQQIIFEIKMMACTGQKMYNHQPVS